MQQTLPFAQVLEAVDHLTTDEQETLLAIVGRRLADQERNRIVDDVREARAECAAGKCHPTTAEELMREITK